MTSMPTPPPVTSSVAASPARTSASPAAASASTAPAPDFGSSSSASFAFFDRASSSWKTSQSCLLISDAFLDRWPSSGSMRSGTCSMRQRSVPRTAASGCSYLPTPLTSDAKSGSEAGHGRNTPQLRDLAARGLWPTPTVAGNYNRPYPGKASGTGLAFAVMYPTPTASDFTSNRSKSPGAQVRMTLEGMARTGRWPTPMAADAHGGSRTKRERTRDEGPDRKPGPNLRDLVAGQLNPTWVEWLMGLPLGWTDVDDEHASVALATASSRSRAPSRS